MATIFVAFYLGSNFSEEDKIVSDSQSEIIQQIAVPRYAPRPQPTIIPAAAWNEAPLFCLQVNGEWVSHILGVLEALDQPDTWLGTEEEIEAARQQVNEIMLALMTNCSPTGSGLFLDDFERADAASVGSNWTVDPYLYTLQDFAVVSGEAYATNNDHEVFWNAASFGPDFEVFVQIGALVSGQGIGLDFSIVNPNTSGADGYQAYFKKESGIYSLELYRADDRDYDLLDVFSGITFAPDNWLRATKLGNLITFYTSEDGLDWTSIGTVEDNTYSTGYFGLYCHHASVEHPITFGAFGGGTLL